MRSSKSIEAALMTKRGRFSKPDWNSQLQNDLDAAKQHIRILSETNDNLRRDHASQSAALITAYRERDEWKAAFQTISRLVK